MKQKMTLEQYLKLGGNIEKVEWDKAVCEYGVKNRLAKILSAQDTGEKGGQGVPLYNFTFDNGNKHRYAISWIKLEVEIVLNGKYF